MSRPEGTAHIPNWLIRDESVGVYEIAVYAALASRSGKGGIWPSQQTIAADARCSERQVREALKNLRQLGVVTWERVKSSRGILNVYLLHPEGTLIDMIPDEGPAQDAGGVRQDMPEVGGGPAPHAGGVRHTVPGKKNPIKKLKSPYVSSDAVGADIEKVDSDARIIARKACDNLAVLIAGNDPHGKVPNVTESWVTEMERLHRIDGRPWPDIKTIIEWSQSDPFWLANIKSPAKLRKHFPALANARDRKPRTTMDAGRDVDAALAAREATPTDDGLLLTRGHGPVLVDA